MANDQSIVQDPYTIYFWGGWDASGFHNEMYVVDLATGAYQRVPIDTVRFLRQGLITNANWTWVPGKIIYLAADGAMTQNRPHAGTVTILGVAYSATTICFNPLPPFVSNDVAGELWSSSEDGFFTDTISDFFA